MDNYSQKLRPTVIVKITFLEEKKGHGDSWFTKMSLTTLKVGSEVFDVKLYPYFC